MKGFLALAVNRLAAVPAGSLRAPLVLILTYDEETGTLGARRLWEELAGRGAPAAERDHRRADILAPVRMHKGHLKIRLTFTGNRRHSGYPHLGENAIEPAGRAVAALSHCANGWKQETPPAGRQFPEVPFLALNLAMISRWNGHQRDSLLLHPGRGDPHPPGVERRGPAGAGPPGGGRVGEPRSLQGGIPAKARPWFW